MYNGEVQEAEITSVDMDVPQNLMSIMVIMRWLPAFMWRQTAAK